MTTELIGPRATTGRPLPRLWPALMAMFLGSFTLVTAEFLPPGVLTVMAAELGVTEGVVGLTVTLTGVAALIAATGMSVILPRTDRRSLLVVLTIGAVISNLVVAAAPNLILLMLARLLLGFAIGGYWSMALVIATRLVPPARVGKAMMIVNAGVTLATVAGVPLGVLLGSVAGWRVVFATAAGLTVLATIALRFVLPPIPPSPGIGLAAMGRAVRAPGVALGLAGIVAVVTGHFAGYTYIRPALIATMEASPATVAIMLALFGVGGLIGNFVIGALVDRWLPIMLWLVPVAIGGSIAAVLAATALPVLGYPAVIIWGVAFSGIVNVGQLWITRAAPDHVEAGSGLVVAGFQAAIIIGSAVGGRGVDSLGIGWTYLIGAVITVAGGVAFRASLGRARR